MFNQADEVFNLRLGHVRAVLSFLLYNEKQRADLQENLAYFRVLTPRHYFIQQFEPKYMAITESALIE